MEKPIFTTLFLFLLLILGVIFLWWPRYQQFNELRSQVRAKKIELQTKEEYFGHLKELDNELKKYSSELAKIDALLTKEPLVGELLDFLEKESLANGLHLIEVIHEGTPFPEIQRPIEVMIPGQEKERLKETSLSFSVAGTYPAFKNFLESLQYSAKLIRVESITFSAEQEEKEGVIEREIAGFVFDLKIKIYSY